tara:strand:+ start:1470 stop:2102 length:633 start_codon:yes stop_codon:yes gene_type:complete
MHRFFLSFTLFTLTVFIGFLWYAYVFLNPAQWIAMSAENQLIEDGTALAFGIAAGLAFFVFLKRKTKIWVYFSSLMALAAAREMDLHKEWTSDSILKSNFYLKEGAGIGERIIGFLVILLLLFLAYQMIRRVPEWIASLWKFQSTAWAIGMGLGALTVAKCLDSMVRWFPFIADFKINNGSFLGLMEESLEMVGAAFFISVAWMAICKVR